MKIINTGGMHPSGGHYSQVIEHNGLLYLSGQLPIDPKTKAIATGIEDQTRQTLANVERLLIEAGSGRDRVLQVRVYISDIAMWGAVNEVYAAFFGDHRPVRSIIPTRELHFGCKIEIEAVGVVADSESDTPGSAL